ncbi:MAG: serine/threonine protein kinase [Polyangiaceae bacterium]|nr:serine/threonine protein kinase [Polyangiaceae bacterium]
MPSRTHSWCGRDGAVVEATHLGLDQRVAMKFMLPHVADREGNIERFMREARAASKLRSEHVPKVLDFGTIEHSMPYLVMELLDGCDLAAMIRPTAPLDVAEVCEIGIQACEALSEAHARGIIHRDIKPANLFVTRRADGSPCVKVLDFGIAKQLSDAGALEPQGLTATDAMIGSPYYMSPEQLRSARDVDARSDIWSLGVTLYQALTCKRPYVAENLGALILCIVENPPVPPHDVRPDIPPALGNVLLKCLQRKSDDRFQNMFELASALAHFAPPRCHVLLDRIRAHCASGEHGNGPAAPMDAPAPRISATPTPNASGSERGHPAIDAVGVPLAPSGTNEPWTGTHADRRPHGAGRWVAIGGATLLGAIATAVVIRSGSSTTAESTPAEAAAGVSVQSVEVVAAPAPSAALPPASAIASTQPSAHPPEPAATAAPVRTAVPTVRKSGTQSDGSAKLPDYGAVK